MIVRMKKTTVLCLAGDRQKTLDKLGELGVIHVEAALQQESRDRVELQKLYNDVNKVASIIGTRAKNAAKIAVQPMSGEDAYKIADNLLDQQAEAAKAMDAAQRDIELIAPWGQFAFDDIDDLKKRGIRIYLCSASEKELRHVREKFPEAIIQIVNEVKGRKFFAVVSECKLDKQELPLAALPESSLDEALAKAKDAEHKLAILNRQLDEITAQFPQIQQFFAKVSGELEFAIAHDSMENHGEVVSLKGFVPVTKVEELKQAALVEGWALLLQDPDNDEPVPTLVKLPKWLNFTKAIFDFVGISQGYREADVSFCFLVFFTIFFGMIVADGGYGAIFLVLSVIFYLKARRSEKLRNGAILCIVLSCASLVSGTLSGNFFAIPTEYLPSFMRGVKFYTGPEGDDNLKWLCFLIAMIHLCFARLWRMVLARGWRNKLNEIGWGMLLAANYYTAAMMIAQRTFPTLAMYLYVGGLAFTLIGINWRDVGDIFNYPFSVIGTFTDTLSYIRLYAVGLSGFYIAKSFNDMGMMVMDISDSSLALPFLILGTSLIILAGHLLNIALSLMGVLVHGIRLNTLEFSTHMGLQWAGYRYKPLKKESYNN